MRTVAAVVIGALLLGGGMLIGFLFAFESYESNTVASAVPEHLIISDVKFGNAWIAVTANNTGITSVTIAKILLNNIKQSYVNPPLPYAILPDAGVVLNVTTNITEDSSYTVELMTSKGNSFSQNAQPAIIIQAGAHLSYAVPPDFSGSAQNEISIDIQNTGTADAHLIRIYIGTSSSTMQNQNSSSLPEICAADGGIATITVNYNWTLGATYYFQVVAQEQTAGPWAFQAPIPPGT
jgi:hypothetical protein